MLHYNPRHVSSNTMLILWRSNCIVTASGIVTLCKRPYSAPVERALNWRTVQPLTESCCIPSEMVLVRYAGVDRAAGYRGMLVQARTGHLSIDIQDSNIATPWG
jgi:hypothetical protein